MRRPIKLTNQRTVTWFLTRDKFSMAKSFRSEENRARGLEDKLKAAVTGYRQSAGAH